MKFDPGPQRLYIIWKDGRLDVYRAKTMSKALAICKKRNVNNMLNAIYCDGFMVCETIIGESFKFIDNGVD